MTFNIEFDARLPSINPVKHKASFNGRPTSVHCSQYCLHVFTHVFI